MAQCKLCGRSGFFLNVTVDGLCNNCQPIVRMETKSHLRVISESMQLVETGKTLDTRLSRCDVVVQNAQALTKYEKIGIETTNPAPSLIVSRYQMKRKEIVAKGLNDAMQETMAKVNVTVTPKAKIMQLSKLLLLLRKYKPQLPDDGQVQNFEKQINAIISRIQLGAYLEEARKAEFKGNKKKALDQYYEALYFLKHDEIDDALQAESIAEIETKIAELSGPQADIIIIKAP